MNKKLKYVDNETIICSVCDKPRYMGITTKNDNELCTCINQDKISVYNKAQGKKKFDLIENYVTHE